MYSSFWNENILPNGENATDWCNSGVCSFNVNTSYTRTPTFDWFNNFNAKGNYELIIEDSKFDKPQQFTINPKILETTTCSSEKGLYGSNHCKKCQMGVVKTKLHTITNFVYFEESDGKLNSFQVVPSVWNLPKYLPRL